MTLTLVLDNRKGAFIFEGKKYDVQVVDLPTIIEAQKTFDKKQFYKVADISQVNLHIYREKCVTYARV